jgi:hypothetical protein
MIAATASVAHASTARPARGPALVPVDGGANYYARFSHGLPASRSYFPIAAWLRPAADQSHLDHYKDFGLNTLVGVECPECADMSLIRANGIHAIIQSDERTRFSGIGSETNGWFLTDEVDMCCGPPDFAGGNGYEMLDAARAGLPQDGRFRMANYGKGVMFWETDSQAAQFVNQHQDVVSDDVYYFTDPNERSTPGYGQASAYGGIVDRIRYLDSLDNKRQPVWAIVELGWPFTESATQGGRRILPAESRAAVWQSIIAGARGIEYFDHNFGPGTPGSTILGEGYADTRAMMKTTNQQITQLAPVLNSPTVSSGWSQGAGTTAMVKWATGKKAAGKRCKSKKKCKKAKGKKAAGKRCKSKKKCKKAKVHLYVFAGSGGSSVEGRFSLPCVDDANAAVVGENRTVPVRNGSFRDHFVDGNAIHIYRVDARSRCGPPRRGTLTPLALPHGGGPVEPPRISVFRVIIAVLFIAMLAFFGITHRPRPAPRRSGKRAKRARHLGMR